MSYGYDALEELLAILETSLGVNIEGLVRPVPAYISLVQPVDQPVILPVEYEATAENITIRAPRGKVWKILQGMLMFDADSNVAARAVTFNVTNIAGADVVPLYAKSVAADEVGALVIGPQKADANPAAGYDYVQTKPLVLIGKNREGAEEIRLRMGATNKQVGDVFKARLVIEERLNYRPG